MPRGVPHSPELRAQVVAAVLAGTTIAAAARQFGLNKALVSRWAAGGLQPVATEKREDLQTLIARYLDAGFRALIVQAEVLGDPEYCRAQAANDLAISHGVLGDKLAGVAATAQALGLIGVPSAGPVGGGGHDALPDGHPDDLDAAG